MGDTVERLLNKVGRLEAELLRLRAERDRDAIDGQNALDESNNALMATRAVCERVTAQRDGIESVLKGYQSQNIELREEIERLKGLIVNGGITKLDPEAISFREALRSELIVIGFKAIKDRDRLLARIKGLEKDVRYQSKQSTIETSVLEGIADQLKAVAK